MKIPSSAQKTPRLYFALLSHELTQYDMKVSSRERMPNIYRLSHLLGAMQKAEEAVSSRGELDCTSKECLLRLIVELASRYNVDDLPPVRKVVKQIKTQLDKLDR